MKENYKKEYEAPMVELIEARVEQGFQPSGSRVGSEIPEGRSFNGDAMFT